MCIYLLYIYYISLIFGYFQAGKTVRKLGWSWSTDHQRVAVEKMEAWKNTHEKTWKREQKSLRLREKDIINQWFD